MSSKVQITHTKEIKEWSIYRHCQRHAGYPPSKINWFEKNCKLSFFLSYIITLPCIYIYNATTVRMMNFRLIHIKEQKYLKYWLINITMQQISTTLINFDSHNRGCSKYILRLWHVCIMLYNLANGSHQHT